MTIQPKIQFLAVGSLSIFHVTQCFQRSENYYNFKIFLKCFIFYFQKNCTFDWSTWCARYYTVMLMVLVEFLVLTPRVHFGRRMLAAVNDTGRVFRPCAYCPLRAADVSCADDTSGVSSPSA